MATVPFQDPRTVVKVTTRLWSDEVGLVDATQEVKPYDPAYQWSNGVEKVEKNHYSTTPPQP